MGANDERGWRLPPAVQGTLRPGDRGAAVAWLGGQLAQLQGKVLETAGEPVFDEAMLRQVKQFQFARGLIPDGNVGAQTLIRLVGETDQAAPKLLRARGEK